MYNRIQHTTSDTEVYSRLNIRYNRMQHLLHKIQQNTAHSTPETAGGYRTLYIRYSRIEPTST